MTCRRYLGKILRGSFSPSFFRPTGSFHFLLTSPRGTSFNAP
jgi:hypothetical protein